MASILAYTYLDNRRKSEFKYTLPKYRNSNI
nr:MAG TPA: hypothetical protein [Caudoviricetes sp.]